MAGTNYAGITPETIAAISGARSAQSQLNGLSNNPATIQALRQANTPYTTVSGQGLSTTAPGALEALGNVALRNKGSQGIREMQAQSDALRGQIRQGAEAELMMGLQQKQQARADKVADNTQAREYAVEDRAAEDATGLARWEREQDAKREAEKADRLNKLEIAKIKAENKGTGLKPTGGERKSYNEAMRLRGVVDGLISDYDSMTEKERADLDHPVAEGLLDYAPSTFQRWGEAKMYETEKGKTYKTKLARLESKLSQLASGMAVTGYEMKDRQKWSPNAPGISGAERQRRVANVRRDLLSEQEAFEQYYPDYAVNAEKVPDLEAREAPQAALDYLAENPEFIDQFEAKYGYRPE